MLAALQPPCREIIAWRSCRYTNRSNFPCMSIPALCTSLFVSFRLSTRSAASRGFLTSYLEVAEPQNEQCQASCAWQLQCTIGVLQNYISVVSESQGGIALALRWGHVGKDGDNVEIQAGGCEVRREVAKCGDILEEARVARRREESQGG